MSQFRITGGYRLSGEVRIHGAKNSILPILAATVLVPGVSVLHYCPRRSDVTASLSIRDHLGCKTWQDGDEITVDATSLSQWKVPDSLMREMRSSVIFLGAMLSRLGRAELCLPGGCELGPRPIDLHLSSMEALGAEVRQDAEELSCRAGLLKGTDIHLTIPSVGATENIMLAACGAEGSTVVYNAAKEPEIADLQNFLNSAGAKISGAGTSVLTIEGGSPLHEVEFSVMGDRIEAATYLLGAACTCGDVRVVGIRPDWLSSVLTLLEQAGGQISTEPTSIRLVCPTPLHGLPPITTSPYPGFPTDAQAPLMAALATAQGSTEMVETMFENRFRHVEELNRMGACIRIQGQTAVVQGVPRLHGCTVCAPDLRGGAALVLAALGAEGETVLTGLHHLDRGYQDFENSLRGLGAQIQRES